MVDNFFTFLYTYAIRRLNHRKGEVTKKRGGFLFYEQKHEQKHDQKKEEGKR